MVRSGSVIGIIPASWQHLFYTGEVPQYWYHVAMGIFLWATIFHRWYWHQKLPSWRNKVKSNTCGFLTEHCHYYLWTINECYHCILSCELNFFITIQKNRLYKDFEFLHIIKQSSVQLVFRIPTERLIDQRQKFISYLKHKNQQPNISIYMQFEMGKIT